MVRPIAGCAGCADGHERSDRRGLPQIRLVARAQRLLRAGLLVHEPDRNIAFAAKAKNAGRIAMPALFLHAAYDYVCATSDTRLADPMREACSDLTEATVKSGHWMAQEQPIAVNAALARWLAAKFPQLWAG
jgi:pimeloyl-ACP methyl ester carboxylesterase